MNRFAPEVVAAIDKGKSIFIRAGAEHRMIAIWVVVVERRVFVRSWSMKERSWWRTFLVDPSGVIEVAGKQYAVRAVRTRSERLKDAIDEAYAAKYALPSYRHYVRDFRTKERRDTTTELVPA